MFKTEKDIACDILGYISNLDYQDDAREFTRLFLMSVENSMILIGHKEYDEKLIYKLIREQDPRI